MFTKKNMKAKDALIIEQRQKNDYLVYQLRRAIDENINLKKIIRTGDRV